jgi:hypothetical protein
MEKMILLEGESELRSQLIQAGNGRSKDFSAQKFIEAFHQIILNPPAAP